jgi:uncharacterized membrane protein
MDIRHLWWGVLCLVVLCSAPSLAQDVYEIVQVRGSITVLPNLFSEEEIELTYRGVSGSLLGDEFRIPGAVSDLRVRDGIGSLDSSKRSVEGITIVRFFFRSSLQPGQEQTVTISYSSSNFTSKSGNLWKYSTIFLAGSPVDRWLILLNLPGNVELQLPTGEALPGLKRIAHEDGATTCEWSASSTDKLPIAIGYSPLEETTRSWFLYYLAAAGIFFVVAVAVILVRNALGARKLPKAAEIAVRILEDRERRIVRELAEGQKFTQAELVKATKLSKATVSRAVVELERRKVVDRERSGRVIRVKLQDWILGT